MTDFPHAPSPPMHAGEVCLPGGKRDAADLDDEATALREAQEEVRGAGLWAPTDPAEPHPSLVCVCG